MVSTAAFHARVRGSVPGLGGLKETKLFLPHPRVKVSIVGSLRDREVACSASDRQGSNFESCVWRTVSSQSSHHPQEVLLAQFSLYVHKGGLKPDSFHFSQPELIIMYYSAQQRQTEVSPYFCLPLHRVLWTDFFQDRSRFAYVTIMSVESWKNAACFTPPHKLNLSSSTSFELSASLFNIPRAQKNNNKLVSFTTFLL